MKSILIKDTTKQERIEIIREWVQSDEECACDRDSWEMYREYINGEKEIAQINEEFAQGLE